MHNGNGFISYCSLVTLRFALIFHLDLHFTSSLIVVHLFPFNGNFSFKNDPQVNWPEGLLHSFRRMRVVVNADDFGYCEERNLGIIRCFLGGVITNASFLVNTTKALALSSAVLAQKYKLPLGLHLNLTEGLPVCPPEAVPSLTVMNKGCAIFRGKHGFREACSLGLISWDEVNKEIRAQLSLFVRLMEQPPTHVDGHQHIHVLPVLSTLLAEAMTGYVRTLPLIFVRKHISRVFAGLDFQLKIFISTIGWSQAV
jgi:predicted glycoside hydrolase/deacetylase ChbG (UPF0249 family)